jgi:ubiquinone/menaquinone biosynthesis C-methylase UbiE
LAFSPISFQAALCLVRRGILRAISDTGKTGATVAELSETCGVSEYGVGVLLDMGLSLRLVWVDDDRFVLDKIGHFLIEDEMTRVNMAFTADVCYRAMSDLDASIEQGRAVGLREFGDWPTIYPGLSALPDQARKSWFEFDHYYSDHSFPDAAKIVFRDPPKRLLDIGGNTGKWARFCVEADPQVQVTIVDLPQQCATASENIKAAGLSQRISTHPINMLDSDAPLPGPADAVWMSQFLDCFAESEVVSILKRAAAALSPGGRVFIMELFWDRQRHEAAAFSMNAISLYFTGVANGTSRFYHSKRFVELIERAGLTVTEEHDDLGQGTTLLICSLRET